MGDEINPDEKENEDCLQNGAMHVLAKAVDDPHLSMEETGAAEELLALASEASLSLSSPIHQLEEKENALPISNNNNNNTGFRSRSTSSGSRKHVCNNCAATSTPFWRKSSDGLYYCNACGLYLRTHNTMRPLALSKNRETRRSKMRPESCGNCGASDTPMWRKTEDGSVVCNACGLYYKLHNQHRQVGSRRTAKLIADSTGEPPSATKMSPLVRNVDFTLARENSIVQDKSVAGAGTRYSLEPQFHHKFDPVRNSNSTAMIGELVAPIPTALKVISGVLAEQPLDVRKLAYLKNTQGRTVPLAPKLPLMDATRYQQQMQNQQQQQQNHQQSQSQQQQQQSSTMSPILANFINSLASTSPENLSLNQVDHPLQPLLTSIVSQKLKEQKRRGTPSATVPGRSTSPTLPINVQAMQQQGYTAEYWSPVQLAEFMQNQQQTTYNQQMVQQAIYNHQQQQQQHQQQMQMQVQQPYDFNGYVNYQNQFQQVLPPEHQQQLIEQQQYALQQQQYHQQHQQQEYERHYNNNNGIQYTQHYQSQNPSVQQQQQRNNQQQNQSIQQQQADQNYFLDQFTQFPEPPRQLSPLSGLKFDKNLIDLVNMQFWQEQDASNGQEQHQQQQQNNNSSNNNHHDSYDQAPSF